MNNVGGTIPNALLDTDPGYLEEAFHFNVSTAHALMRAAVPHMLREATAARARRGRQHLVGDGAGDRPRLPRLRHREGRARALDPAGRRDLAPHIRVNAIAVGSVMTSALEFVASRRGDEGRDGGGDAAARIGEPEDIAAAALYLSSAAGGYVTGKMLEVDGGIEQPNLDLGLPDLTPTEEETS